MKALKALVIGMSVLLVVGLGLVGYGVMRNFRTGATAPATAPTASQGYFSAELPVPAGMHLEQMATAGDRIILRLSGGDGDRILVLESGNGRVAGTIALTPQSSR
jgi:hypothetical protein